MNNYKLELETLQKKQAEELQELELKYNIIKTLEAENIFIPDRIFNNNGEIWLTYAVDNISQALKIIKGFKLVEYGIYNNGTTSIKPLTEYNKKELGKIDLKFNCPYLNLEKYSFKNNTDNTLKFWSYIDDKLVFIKIEIKEGINLIIDVIRDAKTRRKIKTEITCSVSNYNHKIQFYFGSDEGANFRLFFNTIEQLEEVFENV